MARTRSTVALIGTNRMNPARNWTLGFLGTAAAVAASYLWLDRPIALLAHAEFQHHNLFQKLTLIPEGIIALPVAALVMLGLFGFSGRTPSKLPTVMLLSGVSFAVSELIKDQLKFAFGRTWPETWTRNNPSYIRDHAFGFHPFHGGGGYASFPSGHTVAICSVMSVLWICYPRFRVLYALCIAAVAIGLVGANFHFLGDVIAGGFLGSFVGWLIIAMWENGARPLRPLGQPSEQAGSDVAPGHATMPPD
jgi:membrane-associated phospholipid phosphatase